MKVLACAIAILILAGCAAGPSQPTGGSGTPENSASRENAQTAALQEKFALLVARNQELERQLAEARSQGPSPVATPQAPSVPPYVCAGLGQYVYLELSAGRTPRDVLEEQEVLVGFAARGYPDATPAPADQADYAPVMGWAAENPVTLVKRISLVLSQPGYQRVDMALANGFVVQVICHQYQVQRFLILDHAPGVS